jgi:hypothetical protein
MTSETKLYFDILNEENEKKKSKMKDSHDLEQFEQWIQRVIS